MRSIKSSPHFRVILRKTHIWVSEFVGITIVSIILVALVILGTTIFISNHRIQRNNTFILHSKTEQIVLRHTLKILEEKNSIAFVLNSFSRGRLKDEILRSLVEIVYSNSKAFGYDPFLVLAVIHVESYFNPNAKGQYRSGALSGAFGLMQLKVATAREIGKPLGITVKNKNDLFIPEINIPLGIAYLTKMITNFKSLKLGISAYNQGPGTIINTLKNKKPLSIRYYNKVLKSYFKLKKMSNNSQRSDSYK